jgi:hypothetical protein
MVREPEFQSAQNGCRKAVCLKERRKIASFGANNFLIEKNFGEQSWKLANFVRQAKLLITKVSACKCPTGP